MLGRSRQTRLDQEQHQSDICRSGEQFPALDSFCDCQLPTIYYRPYYND
ncbi:hypothetical protein PL8927_550112 [Planktothrix serta PCC 8927]|uniref:Uncharacterized protein n=1 Tax=Planktothrix serta PCC 8927 TaxID=671068 RepID=A0A7Z9E0M4_9CYAN|nr:hypothetical protein PL8927_550112 [Planktothrix serta PCC 8927]